MTSPTRTIVHQGRAVARTMQTYELVLAGPGADSTGRIVVSSPVFRIGSREGNDLPLADETVSRAHCEIVVDEHGFRLRDLGSRNGTFVDGVRANDVYLRPGAHVRIGRSELTFVPRAEESSIPLSSGDRFGPLLGSSAVMRELFATLERVAKTNVTVLVEGPSGTGKELVARAIHDASPRAGGPLVVLDCASIPANLMESELFGHEKGAFTGATERRVGRLEEADGGTLFLDELGELPLEMQPKLLRALETREVRRVGSTKTMQVDVRIVAATNRDLAREVNRGAFREDLYYRLAVVRLFLPPLAERREDIPLLVDHFVRRALEHDPARAERILTGMKDENRKRLLAHPWRGNVRELRNVIERSLTLSEGSGVEAVELPTQRGGAQSTSARTPDAADVRSREAQELDLSRSFIDAKTELLERFEEGYLTGQLARHDGNISRAAAAAGLDRMYFKRLLKKYRE